MVTFKKIGMYVFKMCCIVGLILAILQCFPKAEAATPKEKEFCVFAWERLAIVYPKKYMDMSLGTPCRVIPLNRAVHSYYSMHIAFAVSWPNGMAARVFLNYSGLLRIKDFSSTGVLPAWINQKQNPLNSNGVNTAVAIDQSRKW